MRHGMRARALRPVAFLALLGAVAGGCGLPDGHYGGGSGYYGSPSYHSSSYHRRWDSHRRSSEPRVERWSQQRLQQHWREQAQKAR
jgi:hypothetical protein